MAERRRPIRCRQITEQDESAALDLLARGFIERDKAYWAHAIAVLRERPVPDGYPRYGYVLEAEGALVGILLMIFTRLPGAGARIRCNLSSWYVEPSHRGYAHMLMKSALRRYRDAVFVNVSPAPHTQPIIEANGFSRYAEGVFHAIPSLGAPVRGVEVRRHAVDRREPLPLDLLSTHARNGCISVECALGDETFPFVFLPRRIGRGMIPSAHLVYCDDIAQFVRFAGPLGRFLFRHGLPAVTLDANGPIPGLVGRYVPSDVPKYFRGASAPRLGDLAYTEMVLFGP